VQKLVTNNLKSLRLTQTGLHPDFGLLGIGAGTIAAVSLEVSESNKIVDARDFMVVSFQGAKVRRRRPLAVVILQKLGRIELVAFWHWVADPSQTLF